MHTVPAGAPSDATVAYQVDDLLVDVTRAEVTRADVKVPLPKLSFDLLVTLIETAPRVISLDELMLRVWSGAVVSPETVSQRVKLLRDALADDPKAPRYVAGVRGRGYRLVAPVVRLTGVRGVDKHEAVVQASRPLDAAPSVVKGRHNWKMVAVLAGVVALLGTALFATRSAEQRVRRSSAPPPALATSAAAERSVAVLPFKNLGDAAGGDVLAFGLAEAVLHRLANLQELEVIARTSSFSLEDEPYDPREIGRALNVRYLLEGSVQRDAGRLRVTAQLVDTVTGASAWSVQFDKSSADIFAVQDEIASQVAKALQLSLDAGAADRLEERATTNFDAYLAYLQGRTLLATGRVSEAGRAIAQFKASLQLDPGFAAAYVSLAEAELFEAEFDATEDRASRFQAAGQRAVELLRTAEALDPDYGPVHLVRGYLEAFSDLEAAETSYRRGLELRPNDARGYAGLAAVLFEQPAKRAEALEMLDHARRLDPLEPMHDVHKSVFLLYERGDVRGADALLRRVVQRQPLYLPAITRLGEIAWCCDGDSSEAIQYLEQAIALDPLAHWPRRPLVSAYLDVGDESAARSLIASSARSPEVLRIPLLAYRQDWRGAAELAYRAIDKQLVTPIDETIVVISIRRHAHLTRQYDRAIAAMEVLSGVSWSSEGHPLVPERPNLRVSTVGLADMLLASGERDRGKRLLETVMAHMREELQSGERSEVWYYTGMSVALALSGDKRQALEWLERGVAAGVLLHGSGEFLEAEPAFASLREHPRFILLLEKVRDHSARERVELDLLRASGVVPTRN